MVALIVLGLCAALIGFVFHLGDRCSHVPNIARMEVATLHCALDQYVEDESRYPGEGMNADPAGNQFPLLFNALFGRPNPAGPGGRSAPYASLESFKVAVRDPAWGRLVPATGEQIRDARIEKFILDPWGEPYVYRANKGRMPGSVIKNGEAADIYSFGTNGVDDTVRMKEDSDDIGNW